MLIQKTWFSSEGDFKALCVFWRIVSVAYSAKNTVPQRWLKLESVQCRSLVINPVAHCLCLVNKIIVISVIFPG